MVGSMGRRPAGPGEGLTREELQRLDDDGYVVLRDLFGPEVLAQVRQAADDALTRAPLVDRTWRPGGTLHVDLSNDRTFDHVRRSARLRAAATQLLGPDWQRMHVSLRAPRPGYGAQVLHGAATMRPEQRGAFIGKDHFTLATAIVALVDFTPDNSATRVVARSQRAWSLRVPSNPDAPFPQATVVTCPAGSAIVFPEALMHSGTRNRSQHRRDALHVVFAP